MREMRRKDLNLYTLHHHCYSCYSISKSQVILTNHKEIKSVFDRHVLVSSGPLLTPEQWEVCGVACYRACSNSLQELHQLTMAFSPRSESFYGDVAQVKVAARRDATPEETERLRQLAAQVSNPRFILEMWDDMRGRVPIFSVCFLIIVRSMCFVDVLFVINLRKIADKSYRQSAISLFASFSPRWLPVRSKVKRILWQEL